ncbi:MAG: RNA-binding transcriptional accessory protein [Chlamydiales bacterium 38-26]|nr:MAG: RNA-binding transcriptional accessory protein [Chlamydiales bacterium 38-26]
MGLRNMEMDIIKYLKEELNLPAHSIAAVIKLLSEGNTIPFISRYRKEATGNLDEVQIRTIQEKYQYMQELEDRKKTVLESIESQGKMTEALKNQIVSCLSKTVLEDLYLPYKPKKRTKAAIAKEKGLEPLALRILSQPLEGNPQQEALQYINSEKGVNDAAEALAGALDIVAESISENADIRSLVRAYYESEGIVVSKVVEGKETLKSKFEIYYNFQEKVSKIPSHRYLAIRRGEKEEILNFHIDIPVEPLLEEIKHLARYQPKSPFAAELQKGVLHAFKRHLSTSVETELRVQLKMQSDRAAVQVFAENLKHLLLSAPLGAKTVIGIDPGIRTGCKCVVIDRTGKFLENATIYPFQSTQAKQQSQHLLLGLINKYEPFAIAVGNGTAGRETEAFVQEVLQEAKHSKIALIQVSEAGASVYSASDIAREEFPDLDVTVRGAISIARRLQDPLAELVKVEPKAIGVGQYQHDVYQPLLQDKLHEVVESCVNHVGVELNTASAPLLSYVAGIGPQMALKIVKHREMNGPFKGRKDLQNISGFGPKTFEQSAGFLRVRSGVHPLDASAVHPERYELIEHIAKDLNISLADLIGNENLIKKINVKKYVSDSVGEHTLNDIMSELLKPGRDPRESFEKLQFRQDVNTIKDLKAGMVLEGIVTNVAAFGAFVDIGVHQDGLIHISELTDRFIKDPAEVVHVGQRLKVKVLAVEEDRKRISLTARMGESKSVKAPSKPQKNEKKTFSSNPFAGL